MHVIILSFEEYEEVSNITKDATLIDAYGPQAKVSGTLFLDECHINVYKKMFQVEDRKRPKIIYDICYIMHPDVWGEPINWIRAVSGLAESVNGLIISSFFMKSEKTVFGHIIHEIYGKNAKLLKVRNKNKEYIATWHVKIVSKNMLKYYRSKKFKILSTMYTKLGKLYAMETSK